MTGRRPRTSHLALSNGSVLVALARRSFPHVLEATLVPAIISYVLLLTIGAGAAMIAVLAWTYFAVGRRLARTAIPSILMLATIGLTVRTVIGVASGSTFAYFVQPVATTVVLAAVFAGSVVIGRPVVGRVASDFCHLAPEVAARPAIVRLFAGLTLLWAAVHIITAATTFGMLVSMSPANYVALKTVTCLAITVGAIVLTVSCSIRTARGPRTWSSPTRGSDHVFAGLPRVSRDDRSLTALREGKAVLEREDYPAGVPCWIDLSHARTRRPPPISMAGCSIGSSKTACRRTRPGTTSSHSSTGATPQPSDPTATTDSGRRTGTRTSPSQASTTRRRG